MRGHPAKLLEFDLTTGELRQSLPLPGAEGAWNACTATDGSIYVGTDSNGHLYRYIPGEKEVHDLGSPIPGETWIWDVVAGKDGEVFGGHLPGREGVSISPQRWIHRHRPWASCSRRELCAIRRRRSSSAARYTLASGRMRISSRSTSAPARRREMLPKEFADQEFVYSVNRFGKYLVALLTRAINLWFLIWIRTRLDGVDPRDDRASRSRSRSPDDPSVMYYPNGGKLKRVDLDRPG